MTGCRVMSTILLLPLLAAGLSAMMQPIQAASTEVASIRISEHKQPLPLDGFGAEFDPHFFMGFNTSNGADEEGWELIGRRLDAMRLDRIRVGILPGMHEPVNDNKDPNVFNVDRFYFGDNNQKIVSLRRLLDLAQEKGIKVSLSYWGASNDMWMGSRYLGNYWNAPYDDEEYAENIAALLSFLIRDCGYDNITDLTLFNEPSLGYYTSEGVISFDAYAEMVRTVDRRLRKEGLRDAVRFCLSDDSSGNNLSGLPWFRSSLQSLSEIGELYSTHSYAYSIDTSPETILSGLQAYVTEQRRYSPTSPLVVHEFGTNRYMDAYHVADLETYDRALHLPYFAISLLNAGGTGALYWILFDQFYYNGPEKDAKMNTGLWGFATEDWKPRPTYHTWGVLTRDTVAGSDIFPATSDKDSIVASALRNPTGRWTILAVNRSNQPVRTDINLAGSKGIRFRTTVVTESTLPAGDLLVQPKDEVVSDGSDLIGMTLPPRSFLTLVEVEPSPTPKPTKVPTATQAVTENPTSIVTEIPTEIPTEMPTETPQPTPPPTSMPTGTIPSVQPSPETSPTPAELGESGFLTGTLDRILALIASFLLTGILILLAKTKRKKA